MSCCWAFKHMHQLLLLCMLNSKVKFILISAIFNSLTNSFHVSKDFHTSSFQKKWKQILTEATTFFPTQPNAILSLEGVSNSSPHLCKKSSFLICLYWEKGLSRFFHIVFKNKQQLFIKYPLGPWHFKTEILWQIFKETEVPRKIRLLTQ